MPKNKNYPYYKNHIINNLYDLLKYQKDNNKDKTAISFNSADGLVKKSYSDVFLDVKYLSGYFAKNYKNKNIALVGENSYEWLVCFFAIVLSGNTVVILDKDINLNDLKIKVKETKSKCIVYSHKYLSFIDNTKSKHISLEDLKKIKVKYQDFEFKKIDDSKVSVIFFTSGTTGANKAVALSQKNIAADINEACSLYKPSGKFVSVLPFHHAFGLITSVFMAYNYGYEVFLNSSLKYIMRDIKEQKPDTLFVVPLFVETFYKQIWKKAGNNKKTIILKGLIKFSDFLLVFKIDLRRIFFKSILEQFGGNLSYIICGGAYLNPKFIKAFRSFGIEILNGYGITECSPVIAVNRNFYHKDGSVGVVPPKVKVKIIDGEICIKGDNVMVGYYNDESATKSVIKGGYFHTGDLGYIDDDGFIFITGRKKNIIILSNGENISPESIESELLKDKGVNEVVVFEEDNRLVAAIYPEENYINNHNYFEKLIYTYNKDKPINHQVKALKLREKEFIKNSNKKIIRSKAMED